MSDPLRPRRTQLVARLRRGVVTLVIMLVFGFCAWVSAIYTLEQDVTAARSNSLDQATLALLRTIDGTINVYAVVGADPKLRRYYQNFMGRFERYHAVNLEFVDPHTDPQRLRALGADGENEFIVELGARRHRLFKLTEQEFVRALYKLKRGAERWILFVSGHGERAPSGKANFDYGAWGGRLHDEGYLVQTINLGRVPLIPDNTAVLVIASPQVDYLPGEVALISDYIARGGNLLWFGEPRANTALQALGTQLGVRFVDGTIVDPTTQRLALENPAFALSAAYADRAPTQDFDLLAVFPYAAAVSAENNQGWQVTNLVETSPQAWSETDNFDGAVSFDAAKDTRGPLTLGIALERELVLPAAPQQARLQRVIVFGDGDFLSNAYLGNGGNLNLASRLINWLSDDTTLINLPPRRVEDATLTLSRLEIAIIGFGFLLVVPGVFLAIGLWSWRVRRRA